LHDFVAFVGAPLEPVECPVTSGSERPKGKGFLGCFIGIG